MLYINGFRGSIKQTLYLLGLEDEFSIAFSFIARLYNGVFGKVYPHASIQPRSLRSFLDHLFFSSLKTSKISTEVTEEPKISKVSRFFVLNVSPAAAKASR
jgi:hypothetical protein